MGRKSPEVKLIILPKMLQVMWVTGKEREQQIIHLVDPESLCDGVPGKGHSPQHPPPQGRISHCPKELYERRATSSCFLQEHPHFKNLFSTYSLEQHRGLSHRECRIYFCVKVKIPGYPKPCLSSMNSVKFSTLDVPQDNYLHDTLLYEFHP